MRVHYGFENLPMIKNAVVAVGSFDGVHRGHRLLIANLVEIARREDGSSVIVTFDPHPRQLLRGENRLLTTLQEKLSLLAETELDEVIAVNFTLDFSRLSHTEFLDKYIIGTLNAHMMLNGEGHHFGHNRTGDDKNATQHGISTHKLDRYRDISSTQVRRCIEQGQVAEAVELLDTTGYLVQTPITEHSKLLPPEAVYRVMMDDQEQCMSISSIRKIEESKQIRIISE